MPLTLARVALITQECAHMNQHHAKRLLEEERAVIEHDVGYTIGRVLCTDIDGRQFIWEAHEECGLCGTTGELVGADSKVYDCPQCPDLCCETFRTDYDGNLVPGVV